MKNKEFLTNQVFYKSSTNMSEIPDNSIDLIITSPPYWNLKDYSSVEGKRKINGKVYDLPKSQHSDILFNDLGNITDFQTHLINLLLVWKECERILKEGGKLCLNLPYLNILNGNCFSLSYEHMKNILNFTTLQFYDRFVWYKKNRTVAGIIKGSYPYPGNIHSWVMMAEDILIFTKKKKC